MHLAHLLEIDSFTSVKMIKLHQKLQQKLQV